MTRLASRHATSSGGLLVALVVWAVGGSAIASWAKRSDVPGYTMVNVTDNEEWDRFPRVSAGGLLTWAGRYNLPGASSGGTDYEIFLWDGSTTVQVTDDDVDDMRPVVNNRGHLAWQRPGVTAYAVIEIVLRTASETTALMVDAPPVGDRYPDLNDRGVVTWGRRNPADTGWELAIYDPDQGLPYQVFRGRYAYRPHVNNLDHVVFATGEGVYDFHQQLVVAFPSPGALGYSRYRRSEINDRDEVVLTADPSFPAQRDYRGPRDILFWDGSQFRLIFSGTVWQGRPNLNDSGVVVWEGYGGLAGSTSAGYDREIFVFDPELRTVIQLTDDEADDSWPTVMGDGRIVWSGQGFYPGSTAEHSDMEIFLAIPNGDADGDGVLNGDDNCPLWTNPDQRDGGGVGLGGRDGVGDACQCGDFDGDGRVAVSDVVWLREWFAGLIGETVRTEKCWGATGSGDCTLVDAVILRRALSAGLSTIEQDCPATRPWQQ